MTTAWPGDSATVVRWVRSTLRRAAQDTGEIALKGLEDIEVTTSLRGNDLEHLTLDATGTKLTFDLNAPLASTAAAAGPASAAADGTTAEPEIVARESSVLKNFRLVARPMRIERSRLAVDVQAFDLPIVWLTAAEPEEHGAPESIHTIMPGDDLDGLRGTVRAAMPAKDLAPLITSVARPMLREGGIRLGRVSLEVTQDGADGIHATAYAGVRWKLLMASARAEARIEVTRDAVFTVRDLTVGSRNLLVKVALLFARKRVREAIGKSIDLNEKIADDGTNLRLHDVRVGAGDELSVEGRFD